MEINTLAHRAGTALTAAAVLTITLLAASCADIEEPHVVLNGIELEGISKDGIEFTLLADVTNPNGFGAEIGRLEYRVEVDGTEVARGLRTADVPVAAGETVEVGIPFSLTWKGLEKGLDEYFDGGEHRWRLAGSARLKKGSLSRTFTFSESGEFEGPDASRFGFDL